MSVVTVDRPLVGFPNQRVMARDGIPEVGPGASPTELLGKDHFAATGNAVGRATETTVDTIMKVVRSPEVAIAAIATASGIVGLSSAGFFIAGLKGAVQGAQLGATIGGGAGLFAAGLVMEEDKNFNTYHKALAMPLLLLIGGGLAGGTLFNRGNYGCTGTFRTAMQGAREGLRVGFGVGAALAAIATGVEASHDVVKTFAKRWEPNHN